MILYLHNIHWIMDYSLIKAKYDKLKEPMFYSIDKFLSSTNLKGNIKISQLSTIEEDCLPRNFPTLLISFDEDSIENLSRELFSDYKNFAMKQLHLLVADYGYFGLLAEFEVNKNFLINQENETVSINSNFLKFLASNNDIFTFLKKHKFIADFKISIIKLIDEVGQMTRYDYIDNCFLCSGHIFFIKEKPEVKRKLKKLLPEIKGFIKFEFLPVNQTTTKIKKKGRIEITETGTLCLWECDTDLEINEFLYLLSSDDQYTAEQNFYLTYKYLYSELLKLIVDPPSKTGSLLKPSLLSKLIIQGKVLLHDTTLRFEFFNTFQDNYSITFKKYFPMKEYSLSDLYFDLEDTLKQAIAAIIAEEENRVRKMLDKLLFIFSIFAIFSVVSDTMSFLLEERDIVLSSRTGIKSIIILFLLLIFIKIYNRVFKR